MIRIGKTLRNVIMAILNGDYVLRLGIDRLFGHILYLFLIVFLYLFLLFMMEKTMCDLQATRQELVDLETIYSARACDLAECRSLENTRHNLESNHSKIGMPQKPAQKL